MILKDISLRVIGQEIELIRWIGEFLKFTSLLERDDRLELLKDAEIQK